MPPPPPLMDELVEEIILRLPPDSPASLVRAALVCKRWCRLVADPAFHRRIREFHRSPPMQGFLCNLFQYDAPLTTQVVPMSSPCLPHKTYRGFGVCGSRHGRILLHADRGYRYFRVVVWDPITDNWQELPRPPMPRYPKCPQTPHRWVTEVLCAGTGACDHINCHHGPFMVVLVGNVGKEKFSYVYLSETGAWGKPTYFDHGDLISGLRNNVLAGNALHFTFDTSRSILRYDLCTREMSILQFPHSRPGESFRLTTMEDGRLALAGLEERSRLCLWSRDHECFGWSLSKVIELDKRLPIDGSFVNTPYLVGSTETFGIIFLKVHRDLFTIDLKSSKVTKVYQASCIITTAVPYMSFYTPVLRAPSTDDGPS